MGRYENFREALSGAMHAHNRVKETLSLMRARDLQPLHENVSDALQMQLATRRSIRMTYLRNALRVLVTGH